MNVDYERGLQLLEQHIPSDTVSTFDTAALRLRDILHDMEHVTTDTLKLERVKIIAVLNDLARLYTGKSFYALCKSQPDVNVQGTSSAPTSRQASDASALSMALGRDFVELTGLSSSTQLKPIRRRWALLIGINSYNDSRIQNLKFCVNDVEMLGQTFKQIDYEVISVFNGEDQNLWPTKGTILHKLYDVCQKVQEDDLLVVYFACHGILSDGKALLVTQDTYLNNLHQLALPVSNVIEQMHTASKARRKVLILDACHVGINLGREVSDPARFIDRVYEQAEGFAIIAASTAQQRAYEWFDKQHGVFTYFLLKGLSGAADLHKNGFVTVSNLFAYIVDGVNSWSDEIGGLPQKPSLISEVTGDIPLADYRNRPYVEPPAATSDANGQSAGLPMSRDNTAIRHRALVIGCNYVPQLGKRDQECEAAALQVHNALKPQVPSIQLLTDRAATYQAIHDAFDELGADPPYTSVFVFWSGRVFAGNTYLLYSYDTTPGREKSISVVELHSWFKKIQEKGRSVFVCLDIRDIKFANLDLGRRTALITWKFGQIIVENVLADLIHRSVAQLKGEQEISARMLCQQIRRFATEMQIESRLEIVEPDRTNDFVIFDNVDE